MATQSTQEKPDFSAKNKADKLYNTLLGMDFESEKFKIYISDWVGSMDIFAKESYEIPFFWLLDKRIYDENSRFLSKEKKYGYGFIIAVKYQKFEWITHILQHAKEHEIEMSVFLDQTILFLEKESSENQGMLEFLKHRKSFPGEKIIENLKSSAHDITKKLESPFHVRPKEEKSSLPSNLPPEEKLEAKSEQVATALEKPVSNKRRPFQQYTPPDQYKIAMNKRNRNRRRNAKKKEKPVLPLQEEEPKQKNETLSLESSVPASPLKLEEEKLSLNRNFSAQEIAEGKSEVFESFGIDLWDPIPKIAKKNPEFDPFRELFESAFGEFCDLDLNFEKEKKPLIVERQITLLKEMEVFWGKISVFFQGQEEDPVIKAGISIFSGSIIHAKNILKYHKIQLKTDSLDVQEKSSEIFEKFLNKDFLKILENFFDRTKVSFEKVQEAFSCEEITNLDYSNGERILFNWVFTLEQIFNPILEERWNLLRYKPGASGEKILADFDALGNKYCQLLLAIKRFFLKGFNSDIQVAATSEEAPSAGSFQTHFNFFANSTAVSSAKMGVAAGASKSAHSLYVPRLGRGIQE